MKGLVKKISYSALTDYNRCPHYYKLKHIDRLEPFITDTGLFYGTLLHKYSQSILEQPEAKQRLINRYVRTWKKFCGLYGRHIDREKFDLKSMGIAGYRILNQIDTFFKETYGNFRLVSIEEQIYTQLEEYPQHFKGFIDLIIQLEDKKYVIIDFKTCASAFMFKKYQDKYKDYQLILYKNFYAKTKEIDEKSIDVAFILLEKSVKSKKPVALAKITSGPKKISNSLKWLNGCLASINKNRFMKNRSGCNAYGKDCYFRNTEHCPLSMK